jgi:catechol 2,3-dioxygenase-like lactoylglutathione lyase family enzyme
MKKFKFRKIVETCIYSSNLEAMKDFYVNRIGLEFASEEKGRHVFLKAGKSMLLIFNPENTRIDESKSGFPLHGAMTPPACIHFALEMEKEEDYVVLKRKLKNNKISIEKEMSWRRGGGKEEEEKEKGKSIYFRDPAGNLVEFITRGNWPVED